MKPEDGFAMVYETGRGAARTLGTMAKALRRADALVLATDPDREGEAIAWQVLSWLREQDVVSDRAVHWVAFHEVTPVGVRTALARPRNIDMDLIEAWQARRALDYLVGYGLSPVFQVQSAPTLIDAKITSAPRERPMAWLSVPLLHPGRGGDP